jgi:two-component system alkaline phosphatase synthesis response regulator PhoP
VSLAWAALLVLNYLWQPVMKSRQYKNRNHKEEKLYAIANINLRGGGTMTDKKVLVVDDEIHIVHVVAIKLRNNGYEVITAENGLEAFDLACKEKPDVIVTDFQMPMMTGLELIEKLRQCEQTKDIPVILLTARNFAVTQAQREHLRIHNCLSKPFSPKELLGHIEDILYSETIIVKKMNR